MRFDYGSLDYDGVSFQFGADTPFNILAFEPGVPEWRVEDYPSPRLDGIRFGRDRKNEVIHVLRFVVQGDDHVHARSLAEAFISAWDATQLRSRGGAMATLSISG